MNLFQTVPGGDLAAGRLMAQRLEAGLQIPAELVPLCAKPSVSSQCLTLLETLATNEDQKLETGAAMRWSLSLRAFCSLILVSLWRQTMRWRTTQIIQIQRAKSSSTRWLKSFLILPP